MGEEKKPYSEAIMAKVLRYCAYQERSLKEVKEKLRALECENEEIAKIIKHLTEEGYINEARYANAIAGGKFRQKKWGKRKIVAALKGKNVDARYIQNAIEGIEPEEYEKTLRQLLDKKAATLKALAPWEAKQKLIKFALGKGYEMEVIYKVIQ